MQDNGTPSSESIGIEAFTFIDRDAVKSIEIKVERAFSFIGASKVLLRTAYLVVKYLCSPKHLVRLYPRWKNLSIDSKRVLLSNLPRIIWRGLVRKFELKPTVIETPPTYKSAKPTVSVVIPVFNQGIEIIRAIESVRKQTLSNIEIVIWDDGSTSLETLRILSEITGDLAEKNANQLTLIFHEKNQGVVGARNSAVNVSNGKYIVCLDPDDSIEPTYLEKAFLALEANVLCDVAIPVVRLIEGNETTYWHPELLRWPEICAYNHVPIASMITRELFDSINGFDPKMNGGWEDWDFWIRAAAVGSESILLHEPLFNYTVSDTGRDATVSEVNRKELLKILADNRPKKIKKQRLAPRVANLTEVLNSRPLYIFSGSAKNVVFFVPWLLKEGGAERFLRDLTFGLKSSGFDVAFVVTELDKPHNSVDGVNDFMELTPYVYDFKSMTSISHHAFIRQIVNSANVESIVNVGSNAFYDYLSARTESIGNKTVCDVLFNPIGHFKNHEKTSESFSDVVFVYEELENVARRRRIFTGRSHVVHVGIPVNTEKTSRSPLQSISTSEKLTFGWLGRFSSEKRPSWFLDLAKEFGLQANFIMAGTGPLLEKYQSESKAISGLSVLGFIASPSELYEAVDVMVNTSEIEGISVTAMEALDLGIPMVVTDVGGMRELVLDGINGWVTSPTDFGDIESIIRDLIHDSNLVLETKERIMASGLDDKFNVTKMVQKYIEIFLSR